MNRPTLNLVDYPQLTEDYDDFGRHYTTPTGDRYPSVTTVLGKEPKPALDAWRERLGEEVANRKTTTSSRIGNEYHDICETYVKGETLPKMTRGAQMLFSQAKKELVHVDNVRGIEIPMWSDTLKIAGRSDLIASYKGEPSIIDYKNSRNEKPREYCEGYFLQGAAYSRMFYERYGILIKQIVVIIATWGKVKPTVYVEDVKKWLPLLRQNMIDYNPLWK